MGSQILHMIFFIIITFFLLSFYYSSYILTLNDQTQNNDHKHQVLVLEKLRALLGVDSAVDFSPSPSPLPSPEGPAPSPRREIHRHSHRHHHHPIPQARKVKQKITSEGNFRRVVTAVLVSAGITSALCGVCLFWGCRRFQNHKKKASVTTIYNSSESRSKYLISSQSSVKKVISDPGPDLFYLDSLGVALETPGPCFPQLDNSETVTQTTHDCAENEKEEEQQQEHKLDDEKCCVFGEIVSVNNDNEESVKCGESSDDESFHSICIRLSNASACSLSEDTTEIISREDSKLSQSSLSFPILNNSQPYSPSTFVPPPLPPPPPPPPLPSTIRSPNFTKASKLPKNIHSSPGSNQTPENEMQKFPGGIPPPPCLPPFAKGPPPPPSPPLPDKDGSPLPRLKPLHWDKVRAAPNRSTVWDQMKPSSFEFDEEMIESLFGYTLKNSVNDEAKSKSPSPTKHVLEPKRLQNITILSKALNVSADQVCEALRKGKGLSLRELEALAKMVLNKEEEAKLSNYKGDINELGSAEKFVKAILKVPFAFQRVEAMLYQETFSDEVLHLKKSFSMLEEACKELKSSRLFLKLLEAVLKTGNRMNVGTIRGGAKAFKLDALLKLADVKGTDGKTTLLHFVVQEIVRSEGLKVSESIMGKIEQRSKTKNDQDREEDYRRMGLDLVSGLSTELCNVKKTATIDLDVLANSVSNLSSGITHIRNLVHRDLGMEGKTANFVHEMGLFLNSAEMSLKELQEDENRVLLRVREITEYFHGDVSKDEPNLLRIFVIVRDFLGMLDNVCKQLRNSKDLPLSPFR